MDVREKLVELLTDNLPRIGILPQCDNPLQYTIDEIVERIADHLIMNGVTVQEGISVEDRLPEEKVNCIVHYKHDYCNNDGYWAIGFCFYDGEKFRIDLGYKVTHWMPMPEPPCRRTERRC